MIYVTPYSTALTLRTLNAMVPRKIHWQDSRFGIQLQANHRQYSASANVANRGSNRLTNVVFIFESVCTSPKTHKVNLLPAHTVLRLAQFR